jgi:Pretoxin HINT domain
VHHACFAAGTPVSTLTGLRPIESLKVGDQVLSQDTESGVLGYQPIVGVHHNPPAETVRIRLKGDTVVSTPVHRFWRPGRGWAMARDLNPGDSVRTSSGRAEVVEIRPEAIQPVYNLDVARTHSFFVGSGRLLVRDNSLPPPTFTPFDAEPDLAALAEEHTEPSVLGKEGNQPSETSQGVVRSGSIWDSPGGWSAEPEASNPAPRTTGPGSIWDSPGGSSAGSKESSSGLHLLESSFRPPG